MQKINNELFVTFFIILLVIALSLMFYLFGRSHQSNSAGIEEYQSKERELLERIGEYERREADRIRAEKDRITAEDSRIESEGDRIKRDEAQHRAIRELDRRSGDLLQELEQEIKSLQNNNRSISNEFNNNYNN